MVPSFCLRTMDNVERMMEILNESVTRQENMEVLGCAYKDMVKALGEVDPRRLEAIAEKTDGVIRYNNYLSEQESRNAVASMVAYDDRRGGRWSPNDVFQVASGAGIEVDYQPCYNRWALYATACKMSSDHGGVVSKWTANENEYARTCIELAVSQLMDKDRERWVRWYFL